MELPSINFYEYKVEVRTYLAVRHVVQSLTVGSNSLTKRRGEHLARRDRHHCSSKLLHSALYNIASEAVKKKVKSLADRNELRSNYASLPSFSPYFAS